MYRFAALLALLAAPASAQAPPEPLRTFLSPNPEPGGHFGYALAVLGDVDGDGVPDLLVGAPGEQVSEDPSRVQGRAYAVSGATGESLYTLVSPNQEPQFIGFRGDFGAAVAVLGDLDDDGVADIAVGAPEDSPEDEEGVGAAYVFSGASGTLLYALDHPDARYRYGFGAALANLGDVDGDGADDVGVGAFESGEEISCGFGTTGMVYVFSGMTGGLLYEVAPTAECETYFGQSIDGLGDIDGDGRSDFAVGSLGDAGGGAFRLAGRAHVYSGASGDELYTLESPNAQAQGRFASVLGVVATPDLNGDGVHDLLIGAPGESIEAEAFTREGRAYTFSGADGAPLHTIESPNATAGGSFAFSVGVAGDLDGDGTADLLLSARGEPEAPAFEAPGRLYAASGATGALLFSLDAPEPAPYGGFGWAFTGAADFTGDGRPDLVVSQPGAFFPSDPEDPGRVSLFSTLPVGAEQSPSPDLSLALVPNPVVGRARVTWEADTADRLVVYDVLGRAVETLDARGGEATLDTSGWAPGLYVLRLETAAGVQTQRFTVAR